MRLVKGTFLFALGVCLLSSVFITASAQQGRERSTKKARAAAEQSARAARVFDQIMGTREKSIPQDLIDRAEAVAVFPGVLKGGFIVGGRGGSGVISRRFDGCAIERADSFLFTKQRRVRRSGIERRSN